MNSETFKDNLDQMSELVSNLEKVTDDMKKEINLTKYIKRKAKQFLNRFGNINEGEDIFIFDDKCEEIEGTM